MARKRFATDDDLPWYRYRWAWFVWLGPAIAILSSFILLFVAIKNADTIVDDAYYKSGKKSLTNTSKKQEAIRLGYVASLLLNPDHTQIRLTFDSGKLVDTPDILNLKFQHPTVPEWDGNVQLKRISDDSYQGQVSLRKASHWYLVLSDEEHSWEIKGNWYLSSGDSFVLDPAVSHF